MVLPKSFGKSVGMSVRTVLLMSIAGLLGVVALSMTGATEGSALTLERGLGPVVETSRL